LEQKRKNYENRMTADPEAQCYLPGVPRITYMPYPFQLFQFADRVVFLRDGRFVERQAAEGREYDRIGLYEAAYEPEKVQFYEHIDIRFARELRQVAIHHPYPKEAHIASR
jgi:hypothetical protein